MDKIYLIIKYGYIDIWILLQLCFIILEINNS
jgi:hypothetical protein